MHFNIYSWGYFNIARNKNNHCNKGCLYNFLKMFQVKCRDTINNYMLINRIK
jgi:hypothetical protein